MPKEVLFRTQSFLNREEIGSFLEETGHKLKNGEAIPMGAGSDAWQAGEEYVSPKPPTRTNFEIMVEREGPTDGPTELMLKFKVGWYEGSEDGKQ